VTELRSLMSLSSWCGPSCEEIIQNLQTSPFDRDEHARESWARMSAHHVVDGALAASERAGGPPSLAGPNRSLARDLQEGALAHSQFAGKKYASWSSTLI